MKPREKMLEKRNVKLRLQNVRQTALGKIFLKVEIIFKVVDKTLHESYLAFECENMDLRYNYSKEITILDITSIPAKASILLRISSIQYRPIDSQNIITVFSGNSSYQCEGIAEYEQVPLIPRMES